MFLNTWVLILKFGKLYWWCNRTKFWSKTAWKTQILSSKNKKTYVILICHKFSATAIGYNWRLISPISDLPLILHYKLQKYTKYLTVFPAKDFGKVQAPAKIIQNHSRKMRSSAPICFVILSFVAISFIPASVSVPFIVLHGTILFFSHFNECFFAFFGDFWLYVWLLFVAAAGIGDQCSNKGMKKFIEELSQWSNSKGYCL